MAKRTTTLMDECEAMTREICQLVDARDDAKDLEDATLTRNINRKITALRAKRDALRTQIGTQATGDAKHYVDVWVRS